MKTYTHEDIQKMDELYELQESPNFEYILSQSEVQWMNFVKGRYSIYDFLMDNFIPNDKDEMIVKFSDDNIIDMCQALYDDMSCSHIGKAVMLSDDSSLQKVFFWLYNETLVEE